MVSVQSLYSQMLYDILEPPGGTPTGLVTQQEFLDLLGTVILDFVRQSGLIWDAFTQVIQAGVSAYAVPDRMPAVYYVFTNARIVEKVDLFSNYILGQWQRKPGPTKAYHQDGLPIQTLELIPAPDWNGTTFAPVAGPPPPFGAYSIFQPGKRNLTFVGPVQPGDSVTQNIKETWAIGDTITGVPDSFTPYLVFGILERVFSKDGEAKDLQRALYCGARYREGVTLGRSVMMQLLEEGDRDA